MEKCMNNSLSEILSELKADFSDSADLTIRNLTLKSERQIKAAIVTIEGLCDKEQLSQSVINPLLPYDFKSMKGAEAADIILNSVMASSDVVVIYTKAEIISFITSGFAVIIVDGAQQMFAVGVQGYSFRGVNEPESEVVQRGSREGFSEPLRVNMSLIRRRMKNPDLVFEQMTVGSESQTQLMLCYIKSRVSAKRIFSMRM